jgi:peptide subunit release factor 1 (eRF1)
MESISADNAAAAQPPFPQAPPGDPDGALSRERIDRITGFDAGDLRVISMYLGLDPGDRRATYTELDSLLHEVRSQAKDPDLDHQVRVSLRGDIERIDELIKNDPPQEKAAAIFACGGAGLFEFVPLPRPVRTRVVVGSTPYVRPMLAVLEEFERLLAVVADRQGAHLWEVYLGAHRDAGRVEGPDLRRFAAAGRRANSPDRHEDKGERLERTFFKDLADILQRLSYDVLVFGGHEDELRHLMQMLPKEVSERTIGTFAIDPSTATAAEVRDHAQAILDDHERERQRQLVDEVAESEAAGGLATMGLEHCLWGASMKALQLLLVEEGATAPGVVCDESGWFARGGDVCPVCGRKTRPTEDIIEEVVEAVIDDGGSVRHIREETQLREVLMGARLRFPLPPEPEEIAS